MTRQSNAGRRQSRRQSSDPCSNSLSCSKRTLCIGTRCRNRLRLRKRLARSQRFVESCWEPPAFSRTVSFSRDVLHASSHGGLVHDEALRSKVLAVIVGIYDNSNAHTASWTGWTRIVARNDVSARTETNGLGGGDVNGAHGHGQGHDLLQLLQSVIVTMTRMALNTLKNMLTVNERLRSL